MGRDLVNDPGGGEGISTLVIVYLRVIASQKGILVANGTFALRASVLSLGYRSDAQIAIRAPSQVRDSNSLAL
jgi:hypothetical protein